MKGWLSAWDWGSRMCGLGLSGGGSIVILVVDSTAKAVSGADLLRSNYYRWLWLACLDVFILTKFLLIFSHTLCRNSGNIDDIFHARDGRICYCFTCRIGPCNVQLSQVVCQGSVGGFCRNQNGKVYEKGLITILSVNTLIPALQEKHNKGWARHGFVI